MSFRCSVRALLYVRRATRRWQTKTTPNLPIGKGRYRSQNLLLNKVVPCDCGQSSPGRRTGFFENLISNDLSIIIEHFFLTLLPMLVSCSPVHLNPLLTIIWQTGSPGKVPPERRNKEVFFDLKNRLQLNEKQLSFIVVKVVTNLKLFS